MTSALIQCPRHEGILSGSDLPCPCLNVPDARFRLRVLNEKGLRESELAQGLDKAMEKMSGDFQAIEDCAIVQYSDLLERERVELAVRYGRMDALYQKVLCGSATGEGCVVIPFRILLSKEGFAGIHTWAGCSKVLNYSVVLCVRDKLRQILNLDSD